VADLANSTPVARRSAGDTAGTEPRVAATRGGTALSPLAAINPEAWQTLADRAIEPNGYYLPEWALAANGSPRARAATLALTAHDRSGALIGLLPVVSAWRAFRLPLPLLVSADPFHSLDTPLLDRDAADQAAAGLIAQARDAGAHALLLRYAARGGPAKQAFTRVLAAAGLRPHLLKSWTRAGLDARSDPDTVLRNALGRKKLKELRRLRHRLADHGAVRFEVGRNADEVAHGFDTFLELEASGWKGRRGTAMVQQPEHAARLRRAATELAARGRCETVTLHAGTTPLAAGIVLRHHDRAFFFKLGIDERFARYSPGVQLTLDLTRHLCADPAIALADSTARPAHSMIDPIWRGRLPIGDLLIPLRRNDALFGAIQLALRAHELARTTAIRLLRR
jgi:CelD/BcsL family acetyltransferase involved in cellulose biosynthesis